MTRELIECECVPLLVLYYCNMPEGENMSGLRCVAAVQRPYSRCMLTVKVITSDEMAHERSLIKGKDG